MFMKLDWCTSMKYSSYEQGKQQSLFFNKLLTWQHAWISFDHVEYGEQKLCIMEKKWNEHLKNSGLDKSLSCPCKSKTIYILGKMDFNIIEWCLAINFRDYHLMYM